jgi:hypothetical protein
MTPDVEESAELSAEAPSAEEQAREEAAAKEAPAEEAAEAVSACVGAEASGGRASGRGTSGRGANDNLTPTHEQMCRALALNLTGAGARFLAGEEQLLVYQATLVLAPRR